MISNTPFTLQFKSENIIYENVISCTVEENDFNYSLNPSCISGDGGILRDNITGSAFSPFVTTIGVYNERNELLVVGKLSTPYSIPPNTDITFKVKYDS
jgi:hypothetical protein